MSTTRPVDNWEHILKQEPDTKAAAHRILADLIAYPSDMSKRYRHEDVEQLANALIAWARINQMR